jgi:DNA-binding MarR family transcriptional regulator
MTVSSRTDLVEEALAQIEALVSYQRRAFCTHSIHREISLPQLVLLTNLRERGSMTVSELAGLLGVTAPSVSALIDRMEERELVGRERDALDRRIVHVRIAERGLTLLDELAGLRRDGLQRLLTVMSDEDLGHVVRAIEALRSAMERVVSL